jgi:hypothetical protein
VLVHKEAKTGVRIRINDGSTQRTTGFRFQIYKYFANQKSLIVNPKSKNSDIKDGLINRAVPNKIKSWVTSCSFIQCSIPVFIVVPDIEAGGLSIDPGRSVQKEDNV